MNNGICVMYAFNQKVDAGGRKRIDLIDRYGTIFRNAYVMAGAAMPLNVPIDNERTTGELDIYPSVIVGTMQGEPSPIVLGALDNINFYYDSEYDDETNYEETSDGESRLSDNADVDTDTGVIAMEEVALAAPQGSRLVLKRNGHAVLAGVGVSIQIPSGSYVRISAGGDTIGRIPLVEPLVAVIDQMAQKINALQDEVRALRDTLNDSFTITLPDLNIDPQTRVVVAAPSAGAVFVNTLGFIADVGTSTSEDIQQLDPLTISSATLRVSSATEV